MSDRFARELARTRPDYLVYQPGSFDGSTHDTGNEHFLVFEGPDGELKAVWTQSTIEGQPDQRIVFTRSGDQGRTWDRPRVIAGPTPPASGGMCSWGFPLVSRSGRIYVLYSKHLGVNDVFSHTTGLIGAICSDDAGVSWSAEQIVPMRRSTWDNPDPALPANWIVWQRPRRAADGVYLAGFTRWVSGSVCAPANQHWTGSPAVVEFMRFENLDDDPAPADLALRWHCCDQAALQVPHPDNAAVPLVQEPSTVVLPDQRLFTVMRTATGQPWWSQSSDHGRTWSAPQVLRFRDGGQPVRHPCSPCPIYPLPDGRYVFLYHNHDGNFGPAGRFDSHWHRRPLWMSLGEFRPTAEQPVWFSIPRFLMDNDGVALGYGGGRADLAMYASITHHGDEAVLWYPERKFFLCGKRLTPAMFEDLSVPSA
ncbi:MAG: exo-alpha-sialidase [Fimbriimonadaceae bacterium]|nr:exo-alpha-sialidase [Fimbriimonadaceae bacterium]